MNNKLLASFNLLSNDEQWILQALSVIYAPIGQTAFQELLKKSAIFPPNTVAIIDKTLREKLLNKELIVISPDGWQCPPDIVEHLTRLAARQPWFNKLAVFLIADHKPYYSYRVILANAIKKLRIFLYQDNDKAFIADLQQICAYHPQGFTETINRIFFNDFCGLVCIPV